MAIVFRHTLTTFRQLQQLPATGVIRLEKPHGINDIRITAFHRPQIANLGGQVNHSDQ
jgi:hypothetical protein